MLRASGQSHAGASVRAGQVCVRVLGHPVLAPPMADFGCIEVPVACAAATLREGVRARH
ncbi:MULTISPECIES: hypothetical protein [Amycolatopsis]|uniref:hypothetical protein n=1 Tax=Amycolatopsis TaxID=1813 RepID=UPI00131AF537|nr:MULTISPECIES: hypothetical protein [Amycolatopsis]MCG3754175.1 hypothetical protein [Amycolatopsis sp. Poz14]